ncbi:MAG: class I SAM-dependent methyltransferase [Myxococcota bacterium]
MYTYDEKFFAYTNAVSARSADVIVPLLYGTLAPKSVLDLGCGCGIWLARWIQGGAADATGIDGDYVDPSSLAIPSDRFVAGDLGAPVNLGRKFDLAQSLEVAEHLPPERASGFVADLCEHADIVFFGAAPPGQGGENHINEQPYDYWRALFAQRGYDAYDFVRPRVIDNDEVAPWHRYNPLLYVRQSRAASLPREILDARVPDDVNVPDLSPAHYRVRKALVRQLPGWATDALANVRKRMSG